MRALRLISVATAIVFACMGNRPVPKWQAFGNRSLNSVARCTSDVFSRFGIVKWQVGNQPEAGRVRLLLIRPPRASAAIVTAYLDGDAQFALVWMDATDPRVATAAWAAIKRSCGVS